MTRILKGKFMKLSEYLKENKITQNDFLQQAKENHGATFSKFALVKWCNGSRIPRPEWSEFHSRSFSEVKNIYIEINT